MTDAGLRHRGLTVRTHHFLPQPSSSFAFSSHTGRSLLLASLLSSSAQPSSDKDRAATPNWIPKKSQVLYTEHHFPELSAPVPCPPSLAFILASSCLAPLSGFPILSYCLGQESLTAQACFYLLYLHFCPAYQKIKSSFSASRNEFYLCGMLFPSWECSDLQM